MSISLEVEHLCKTYRKKDVIHGKKAELPVTALNDVSFSLSPGFYGLLGPNGSGKSSLMNIIVGNLLPDSGIVLWDGEPVQEMGIRFRRILGYVPQQQTLYRSYTGRRFLQYMAVLKEIPADRTESEIERTARIVNLSEELDKKLSAYSGGMKQRLLTASALLGTPKLLIMDEPMAGLDPKERVHLRDTLSALSKDCIILMATHVVSDIEKAAKEIMILKKGVLVDKGTPSELENKYAPGEGLESVYMSVFEEENR